MFFMDIRSFSNKLDKLTSIVEKENSGVVITKGIDTSFDWFVAAEKAGLSKEKSEIFFVRFFVKELTKYLGFSFPDAELTKVSSARSFASWFEEVRQVGIARELATSLFLRFFNITKVDMTSLKDADYSVFDGGIYLEKEKLFCFRDINSMVFHRAGNCAFLSGFYSETEDSDRQEKIKRTLSSIAARRMFYFSHAGVEHAELKGETFNICVGRRKVTLKTEEIKHFPVTKVEIMNSTFFEGIWEKEALATLGHIKQRRPGQHIFFFGDYVEQVESVIREMGTRIYSLDFCDREISDDADGVVTFVDMDKLTQEKILSISKLTKNPKNYFIFVSKSINFTHFYATATRFFEKSEFLRNWGGNYSKIAIPKLCPHCKKPAPKTTLVYEAIAVSETIENSYQKGLGCSHCVSGYIGFSFVSENIGFEFKDKMVELVVNSTKRISDDAGDQFIRRDEMSPYVMPENYYKLDAMNTAQRLIMSLIKEGDIQVDDARDLLI